MARSATTTDVFNAVGDATRRAVIDVLSSAEMSVGEIAAGLQLAQPQVSKHLKVLGRVGLVRLRVDGRRHLYRLDADGLLPIADWVSGFEWMWNERLDRIDDVLAEIQRHGTVAEIQRQGGTVDGEVR